MSAWIVPNQTIADVVEFLFDNKYDYENKGFLIDVALILDKKPEELKRSHVANALFKMNTDAVNQRYDDNKEAPKYRHCSRIETSLTQVCKSLQCLRYQCHEGNVPETKLYLWLDRLGDNAFKLAVTTSKEWDEAKWGR